MQETREYQLIDNDNLRTFKPECKLCIITVDINSHQKELSELIQNNPQSQFWLAVSNMYKDDILLANKLGITNIISYPVEESVITEFFDGIDNTKESVFDSDEFVPFDNANVMIIDDNIMNIQLLEEVLKGFNLGLEVYTHPQDALMSIKSKRFDLFLLDILMPELSGFDIAQEIKKSPVNKNVPIIFVSALSNQECKINGYKRGANLYIEKPYDISVVRHQIYNILKEQTDRIQSDKSKDKQLAMITHDLKSPISAEITALQLLLKEKLGGLSSTQHEIIADILSSAKFLKRMTDNILCTYKCTNGEIKLNKEEFDLKSLILDSINELKYLFEEKGVRLTFKSNLQSAYSDLDVLEMKRVVSNLVGNAVDYAPSGTVVKVKLQKKKGAYWVSVEDRGRGINLENPNQIFEDSMTLSKEEKRIGFGLGLFISKNIIQAHGGDIFARSKIGKGTTIYFTIPDSQIKM